MRKNRFIQFENWVAEDLKDEEFRAEYERLGPGFKVARLRMLRGLTQEELAQRVGTHQSSISRLESGEKEPSLSFLRRVVEALDGRLEVNIVAAEESAVSVKQESVATITQSWSILDTRESVNWTDRQSAGTPVGEMVPV